jgi:autotransporter-associated beta strand protein
MSIWQPSGEGPYDFGSSSNWQGSVTPTSNSSSTILKFSTPGAQTINLADASFIANQLLFSALNNNAYTSFSSSSPSISLTIGSGGIVLNNAGRASFALPVVLDDAQTWDTGSGLSLEFKGSLSGAATITKIGAGNLRLCTVNDSGFTGSLLIREGELHLATDNSSINNLTINSALELGSETNAVTVKIINPVTVNQGSLYIYPLAVDFAGKIDLYTGVSFVSDASDRFASASFSNSTALLLHPISSGSISTAATPQIKLSFSNVDSTLTGTVWTLSGGGNFNINGTLGSNISTISLDSANLAISSSSALPSNTGHGITSSSSSSLSLLGGDDATANTNLLGAFITNSNAADFAGTLFLDTSSSASSTAVFFPSSGNASLNLSGFSSSSFRIGSHTDAILETTPSIDASGVYRFGNGGGTLTVNAPLTEQTASTGLNLTSEPNSPLSLVLTGTNTFTGKITVNNSFLFFSSDDALPTNSSILLESGGFASLASSSNTPIACFNTLLSRLDSNYSSEGILELGLDSGMSASSLVNIDLRALPRSIYLGTFSNSRIGAGSVLLAPSDDKTLKFAALGSGCFIIDAVLADQKGALSVVYGHPNSVISAGPTNDSFGRYVITGDNTYSGGTTIYSGCFNLTNPKAFGSGTITIANTDASVQFGVGYMEDAANFTLSSPIQINSGAELTLRNFSGEMSNHVPLSLTGLISGPGGLLTYSNVNIAGANTYSGGTTVTGILGISGSSPLGTGTVTMTDGSSLNVKNGSATLTNSVLLGNGVSLLTPSSFPIAASTLLFTGTVRTSLSSITTYVHPGLKAVFSGGLSSEFSSTDWIFANPSECLAGGLVILSGTTSGTVNSVEAQSTGIIFTNSAALPSSSVQATYGGLVGVSGSGGDNNSLLTAVLEKITYPSGFNGVLSLDTLTGSTPNTYGGSDYSINLSSFESGSISIGSTTQAIIADGTGILPASGGNYSFGGGGGTLFLQTSLPDLLEGMTAGLKLKSPDGMPLTLFLQNANAFSKNVEVENSFLVVDHTGAIPGSGTNIQLFGNGYASYTPNSDFATPADFISRIDLSSITESSIVGIDSATPASTGVTLAENQTIDLSATSTDFYLGTISRVLTIPKSTTLKPASSDGLGILKFAALQGGSIDLSAPLLTANTVNCVVYGHSNQGIAYSQSAGTPGSYIIRSSADTPNDYTDGTTIFNGSFQISGPNPFGTGSISIDSNAGKVAISSVANEASVVSNDIMASNSDLHLGALNANGSSLTFSGSISGAAKLDLSGDVTLSGSNSYEGGTSINPSFFSTITLASDYALGTGPVSLGGFASLILTSDMPSFSSLNASGGTLYVKDGAELNISQRGGETFSANIVGGTPSSSDQSTASVNIQVAGNSITTISSPSSNYSGGTSLSTADGNNNGVINIASTGTPLGTGSVTLNGVILQVSNPATNLGANFIFNANEGTTNTLAGIGAYTATNPGGLTIGYGMAIAGGIRNPDSRTESYTPGTLTFNNTLTFSTGGAIELFIKDPTGTAGVGYGLISVNGTIDFNVSASSFFLINPLVLGSAGETGNPPSWLYTNQNYSLIVAEASSITNFDASKLILDTSAFVPGAQWSFNLASSGSNTQLVLNFNPVPEPETWAMMLAGSAAVLLPFLRRNRKKTKQV